MTRHLVWILTAGTVMSALEVTANVDIDAMVAHLAAASRIHLRAFAPALARHGYEPCEPAFLDREIVAEVMASEHERATTRVGRVGGPKSCDRAEKDDTPPVAGVPG